MFWLVAVWAFAEAILFFIVADVPISLIAVRHGRGHAALAALVAAVAAAAGGAVVYGWAGGDPAGAREAMTALPAIDPAMIDEAARSFAVGPGAAMFAGAFSGVPYKLYALAAPAQGVALLPFLLLSVLLRLPRFLAVALLAAGASHLLARWLSMRARLALLAWSWLVLYAGYFAVMPG